MLKISEAQSYKFTPLSILSDNKTIDIYHIKLIYLKKYEHN
jgi:hypothetical protein